MLRTSAYRLRIRTDSADEHAIMLLSDGQLVAILVELTDEIHGDACGKWVVESVFGLACNRTPENFDTAGEAAAWVTTHISFHPFILGDQLVLLG